MAKDPVVVRIDTNATARSQFTGRREALIADELQRSGIPATGGANGVTVSAGTLEVASDGLQTVFTWTPPDATEQMVRIPVPAGDNNVEVKELQRSKKGK